MTQSKPHPDEVRHGRLEPTRLSRQHAEGRELDEMAPWPQAMQARRIGKHAIKTWFRGTQLTSIVYEAEEGMLHFPPLPYDEHVCVLRGRAVLITEDGARHEFSAGDVFVVPKGWSGTWELLEGYRELCTFETQAIDGAMSEWFP